MVLALLFISLNLPCKNGLVLRKRGLCLSTMYIDIHRSLYFLTITMCLYFFTCWFLVHNTISYTVTSICRLELSLKESIL